MLVVNQFLNIKIQRADSWKLSMWQGQADEEMCLLNDQFFKKTQLLLDLSDDLRKPLTPSQGNFTRIHPTCNPVTEKVITSCKINAANFYWRFFFLVSS